VKRIFTTLGVLLIMLSAFGNALFAQARVTGHVFAEVVESIGANSNMTEWVLVQPNRITEEIDLGKISINGGAQSTYGLILTTKELTGKTGAQASFLAKTDYDNSLNMLNSHGKQVLRLYGNADEDLLTTSDRNFTTSYQIIFAYN
jgi:hypothetical protein